MRWVLFLLFIAPAIGAAYSGSVILSAILAIVAVISVIAAEFDNNNK